MLEKNDLIQLKARTLERLQEVNVEDYALDQTDVRLKDYVKSAISHPDDHNLYELLSILRFFRLLDAYIFKPTEVKKFIVFYENLKFSGLKGRVKYRLTPIQVFQFANILGFYRTPEKGFAGTPYYSYHVSIAKRHRLLHWQYMICCSVMLMRRHMWLQIAMIRLRYVSEK